MKSRRCFLFALALLYLPQTLIAKKTPEPTSSPTKKPTASPFPSISPTSEPTSTPSFVPTKLPTTSNPTDSALPSVSPTKAPTASPTGGPTGSPTASPTSNPTKSPSPTESLVSSVPLPIIGIDLVVSDDDAVAFDVNVLTVFISNILDINSNFFDFVSLSFDVIQSDFDRRRLESGLSVRISGIAYYGEDPPTEEYLAHTLEAYFSFWGANDLEAYLRAIGISSVAVASVSIAGENIEQIETANGDRPGASVQEPTQEKGPIITPGIIAGLAAGTVVLLLAIAFFVTQGQKSQSRRGATRRSNSSGDRGRRTPPKPASRRSQRGARPSSYKSASAGSGSFQAGRTSREESDSDCISVDNSLYTTDDSVSYSQRNAAAANYNPSRLDRVIAAAKENP